MEVRYFECKEDGSNKFWEISIEPEAYTYFTRWGPLGGTGTKSKKLFSSRRELNLAVHKIISSKTAKGYKERLLTKPLVNTKEEQKIPAYLEIW